MSDRPRLVALDVFRGATVAAMLLVNNPGSWAHVYPPLLHAAWHGWTLTDLIFPFFLFIVGVTTHLSLARQHERGARSPEVMKKVAKRGVLIVLAGLLLNWFPFHSWGEIPGVADPGIADRVAHRWQHLRWSGVLQRIGIVYLIAAPLVWRLRRRALLWLVAVLLAGYAALLLVVPVPGTGATGHAALADPDQTLAAWSDRLLLSRDHIWRGGMWDPEGPLSTIPAIATALLGALVAPLITTPWNVRRMMLIGVAGALAGIALSPILPINKNLWTSSYVIFTAGFATALLAATVAWLHERAPGPVGRFFATFGLNPLVAFIGSGLMTRLLVSLIRIESEGRRRPVQAVIHEAVFASWMTPRMASLAWGVTFVLVWYVILRVFEARKWIVKI